MMEESLQIIHSIVDTIFVNRVTEKETQQMQQRKRMKPSESKQKSCLYHPKLTNYFPNVELWHK
jgi:hypothetical protein